MSMRRLLSESFRRKVFYAVCLAAAMAIFCLATASAQEEIDDSYVDLSVNFDEHAKIVGQANYYLEAENTGTADAFGVRVDVLLTNQQRHSHFGDDDDLPTGERPIGTSYSSIQSNGKGDLEGTWEIDVLEAGESVKLYLYTNLDDKRSPGAQYMMVKNTATISSDSSQGTGFLRDNTAVAWAYLSRIVSSDVRQGVVIRNRGGVMVSVDDQYPQPGDSVKFTLVAANLNPTPGIGVSDTIADVEVSVSLGRGLEFASGWTPNPSQGTFSTSTSSSGTWDVGVLRNSKFGEPSETVEIQASLTAESLEDIPLEDRCFTALVSDMKPTPDPGYFLGRLRACLGDDPPVLFTSGKLDLPTVYPCVGVSTSTPPYPCRNEDNDNSVDSGLELVVSAPVESNPTLRARGVGRFDTGQATSSPKVALRPENVIIQIKDPEGRVVDGSSVSWQTAGGSGNALGVQVREYFDLTHKDDGWSNAQDRVSATGANGGSKPGSLSIKDSFCDEHDPSNCHTEYANADWPDFSDPLDFESLSLDVFYELGALGTYFVKREVKGTHSGTTYTPAANFDIHVGPISELAVRDGGASMEVPAGQRAFTIVAVNNGPDDAPAAQVTVTGLSTYTGDVQDHSATRGSFDPATGVWTIGELKTREYARAVDGRDGEVLTIITGAADGTEITASIANTLDYQVCIDSSGNDVVLTSPSSSACTTEDATNTWHTAKYYDYDDRNASATIAIHEGTGTALPSDAQAGGTRGVSISWKATPSLFGRAVAHYEVQRQTNPWVTVATTSLDTYVDTDVEAGDTFQYRIRAVNDLNHKGPWSPPITGSAPAPEVRTVVRTVTVGEDPFAYFPSGKLSRTVAENSAPGSPVGAPVTVVRNSGNNVVYSLEGADAALFRIEPDSGQILVGQGAVLDFESDRTSYSVEVVADPSQSSAVRTIVNIEVVDVAESDTEPEVRIVTVVRTETVTVEEDPFAYFPSWKVSRSVAENSPPGSPVGAPVAVVKNSGNDVRYSLEGADAALFRIEPDSGQILVGQWTVLDFESDRTSYSVEVVAEPSRSSKVWAIVNIEVVDVAESASVSITPDGQPRVGHGLTATLTHGGGEPVEPRWQWYRSTGGPWAAIEGADEPRYTPTERDAGARLRVIATYGEPDGGGEGVAGAVTQALAGEPATAPVARSDANGDGRIDLSETLAAIAAYFRGELDHDDVMEVIGAYYAG